MMDHMEETRIEKILRKKTSRRNVLKGLGGAGLGLTFGAAIGTLIGKTVAEKGIKLEEDLFPSRGELYGKEITGEVRPLILEPYQDQWPIIRKEPNQGTEVGRAKPDTQTIGVEIWGVIYSSGLGTGEVEDPQNPKQEYGKWVRLEGKIPLYDENGNPKLDDEGVQKMVQGFVAENFVTFLPKEDSSSP